MRRLFILQLLLVAVICCGSSSAQAQYFNKVYYSPGHPIAPTTPKACSDFEAEWEKALEVITKDHDSCLDAHTHDTAISGAGDVICSRAACQSLHDIMFRYRRESKAEIEACNKQVEAYQKAERERKDEEALRKAEEAQRQREAAAQRAAAEAALRAQRLEAQQKAFDEETKRRNEVREKLAAASQELESKLADAQQKRADEQKLIADRQMEAMKSEATVPPPPDVDKLASGFDLSGVDKAPGNDDHLFNINSTTAQQIFTEIGSRLRDGAEWLFEQTRESVREGVTDQLSSYFTKGDYAPYHDAVSAVVTEALRPLKEDAVNRGSLLRETVIDKVNEKTTDAITEWAHDQSVTAYAARSPDPIEYQVNRAFSASQLWNVGFGFKAYLTKINDEALKGVIIGLGMMTDDLEQSR